MRRNLFDILAIHTKRRFYFSSCLAISCGYLELPTTFFGIWTNLLASTVGSRPHKWTSHEKYIYRVKDYVQMLYEAFATGYRIKLGDPSQRHSIVKPDQ